MVENIGALAAIALSIIGLAGLLPDGLAAVATIIVGAIFLMEGGTVSAAFRQIASRRQARTTGTSANWATASPPNSSAA